MKEGESLPPEIAMALQMGGPGFGISSDSSIALSFDDIEEIKEHPMGAQLMLNLD